MDLQLSGQRAFVTGSTQGIGYAVADALLREGARVVVNGRTEERVRAATERLAHAVPGADVTGIAADLAQPAEVVRVLDRLGDLGDLDILVNNVGAFEVKAFEDVTDEDWQAYFELNVMSGVRLSRGVLAGMLERGAGRIIFVSSESGVDVPADMVHYGVTKAAVLALGNGLAKRTRGTRVTVNTILGGPTYSDGVAGAVEQIAQVQGIPVEQLKGAVVAGRQTSLVQRFIEPREIADLAAFLASPLSSATNGAALRADGGVLTGLL